MGVGERVRRRRGGRDEAEKEEKELGWLVKAKVGR